ncbi:ribonuclease P protein component [Desmospora sp. 8437]|nr:ribonuclease P protein component [Desmospora sp. 8437]
MIRKGERKSSPNFMSEMKVRVKVPGHFFPFKHKWYGINNKVRKPKFLPSKKANYTFNHLDLGYNQNVRNQFCSKGGETC